GPAPRQLIQSTLAPGSGLVAEPPSRDVRLAGFADSNPIAQQPVADDGSNASRLPEPNPPVLRPPVESYLPPVVAQPEEESGPIFRYEQLAPSGFTGPSGILPREDQMSSHFVPLEDRWRSGFPEWDRYGRGHPLMDDYPYAEGNLANSYKQ